MEGETGKGREGGRERRMEGGKKAGREGESILILLLMMTDRFNISKSNHFNDASPPSPTPLTLPTAASSWTLSSSFPSPTACALAAMSLFWPAMLPLPVASGAARPSLGLTLGRGLTSRFLGALPFSRFVIFKSIICWRVRRLLGRSLALWAVSRSLRAAAWHSFRGQRCLMARGP